jgi:hypothetical protein
MRPVYFLLCTQIQIHINVRTPTYSYPSRSFSRPISKALFLVATPYPLNQDQPTMPTTSLKCPFSEALILNFNCTPPKQLRALRGGIILDYVQPRFVVFFGLIRPVTMQGSVFIFSGLWQIRDPINADPFPGLSLYTREPMVDSQLACYPLK